MSASLSRLACAATLAAATLVLSARSAPAQASADAPDPALVESGRALATAADCAACHGPTLKGGAPIKIAMGSIYASNITPDARTGIGAWSLKDLDGVLRKGVAPGGRRIYPAMPYTSYTGLTDAQVRALYAYLKLGVRPVTFSPPETKLPFPFVRPAMIFWNALFFHQGHAEGAVAVSGPQLERGRLLVETLEHCTACHTPRGMLMQPLSDKHLSGGVEAGWWAPNITRGPGGIGDWSDDRLRRFLTTGHTDVAVAGDDMATAVSMSLSRLPPDDISAIIAYLRAVPARPSSRRAQPASSGAQVDIASLEAAAPTGWRALAAHDDQRGDLLYQSACASCHGMNGDGSAGLSRPSLRLVGSVRSPQGVSLVRAIADGIDRRVGDDHAFMPPFRASMSDAQIASVSNYVRTTFGGVRGDVSAGSVADTLDGRIGAPWLILNATWLSVAGLVAAVGVVLGAVVFLFSGAKRRPPPRAVTPAR